VSEQLVGTHETWKYIIQVRESKSHYWHSIWVLPDVNNDCDAKTEFKNWKPSLEGQKSRVIRRTTRTQVFEEVVG
jgi:hypothetical protein